MLVMRPKQLWGIAAITGLSFLAILAGCHSSPTVWKQDVRSPDGAWIATARTDQWGGFGSAWVETTGSIRKLNKTVNNGKPFDRRMHDHGWAMSRRDSAG